MSAKCSAHHFFHDLNILIIFCREYESRSFALLGFLKLPTTSFLLGPKILLSILFSRKCPVSSVDIATRYELKDRGVGVRVLLGSSISTSPYHSDRLWGSPSLLSNGYRVLFLGEKRPGRENWPLISNYCRGQENVGLYIHFPIHLHDLVLN
jgi:hypothetical protein